MSRADSGSEILARLLRVALLPFLDEGQVVEPGGTEARSDPFPRGKSRDPDNSGSPRGGGQSWPLRKGGDNGCSQAGSAPSADRITDA
jgi:hypothetical protein